MMNYVKLTKIGVVDNPQAPTAKKDDWVPGQEHDSSPFVDYTLEGFLMQPIQIGQPIHIDRRIRNGVEANGYFRSTPVEAWEVSIVSTKNSKYLVQFI